MYVPTLCRYICFWVFLNKKKKEYCDINVSLQCRLQSKNTTENFDSSVFLETLPGCCGPREYNNTSMVYV